MGLTCDSCAKIEVLMAIILNIICDATQYGLMLVYRRFGVSCRLHVKGRRIAPPFKGPCQY